MGLEAATHVGELNSLWPLNTDDKSFGDDHLRVIKSSVYNTARMHMGATPPTAPFAQMLWADTSTNLLKRRNTSNSAWNIIGSLNVDFLPASQVQAETGTDNQAWMTPLRVAQAIAASTGPISVGDRMVFYQASAPVKWTQVSVNDFMLRAVSGVGGGSGGTMSPISGLTITNGHGLTSAENGPHTHSIGANTVGGGHVSSQYPLVYDATDTSISTVSSGSGTPHTHGISWQPKYLNVIVCQYNG